MFKNRLNTIMEALNANNQDIAGLAGIDRTNITRFRSGERIPKYGSDMSYKLALGLSRYAHREKCINVLADVVGFSTEESEEKTGEEISRWLFEGMKGEDGISMPSKREIAARSFGERLNAAITLSGLSNVRLSQLINTDASLISRYRSGLRMPRINSEIIVPLEQVLWKHIYKKGNEDDLARAIRCSREDLCEEAFFKWLFDYSMYKDVNITAAEKLLEIFESYSDETGLKLPDAEPILSGPEINDGSAVYFGNEGLRSAVIRFLAGVVRDCEKELWLYSEEDMSWMIGDEAFRMKWAVLMSECVRRGTKIRIIHNIDRNLDEMIGAIKSWLPLYMSGMIEPYYCTRIKDSRFIHTIFLCPGKYCIEACNVSGTGNEGIYNFYDDELRLEKYRIAYDKLLENSKPLLRFNIPDYIESGESDIMLMQNTLSLATMPEELINDPEMTYLYDEWKARSRALRDALERGSNVYELIPKTDPEDNTYSGIPVENVYTEDGDAVLMPLYTKEQYLLHIKNIMNLSEKYDNYHFCAMSAKPFSNMKILCSKEFINIINVKRPQLSFCFTHPLMCRAFMVYLESMRNQYGTDEGYLGRICN